MGAIRLIEQLTARVVLPEQPWIPQSVEETSKGVPILRDAVEITLAEYDTSTKDAITAHHLKDYRQRTFRLALLPRCDILFDQVLEGSDYWRELLHSEVHFS